MHPSQDNPESQFESDSPATPNLRLTPLGENPGATCLTYKARIFGKLVFIKELKAEFATDARYLAAFRKEAEIGFNLDHPNLPRYIFTEGVLHADRYVAQEFIDGFTLPEFIKRYPAHFSRRENLDKFIREFVDVLHYLHSNQVLHLDIKPDNVLITRVGHSLKLVDFGFCSSDSFTDSRGKSPAFSSPERMTGAPPDEKVDFFSLGKILEFIRLNSLSSETKKFIKLEQRLLSPNASHRISSKDEVYQLLNSSRHRPAFIICACIMLAVCLGAGFFLFQSKQPDGDEIKELSTAEVGKVEESVNEIVPPEIIQEQIPEMAAGGSPTVPHNAQKLDKEPSDVPLKPIINELTAEFNDRFEEFDRMLNLSISEERYNEEDCKQLLDIYNKTSSSISNIDAYTKKYPQINEWVLVDLVSGALEQADRESGRLAKLKAYVKRCQASEGL